MSERWLCEFCGKERIDAESTSFVGNYCLDCHRLNRYESLYAIHQLQQRAKQRQQDRDASNQPKDGDSK